METKEILKTLRKSSGLSAQEVADNCDISIGVYKAYESGQRGVGVPALCKIAEFYGVSVDYLLGRTDIKEPAQKDFFEALGVTKDSKEMARRFDTVFKQLPETYQALFCEFIARLLEQNQKEEHREHIEKYIFTFPTYKMGAAAAAHANGVPLDNNEAEMRPFDTSDLKQRKDGFKKCFVVPVEGDSMKDAYEDGDMVLVHPELEVMDGEIGIFAVDGEGFIKRLKGGILCSDNPDCDDIFGEWQPVGKVLGKVYPIDEG